MAAHQGPPVPTVGAFWFRSTQEEQQAFRGSSHVPASRRPGVPVLAGPAAGSPRDKRGREAGNGISTGLLLLTPLQADPQGTWVLKAEPRNPDMSGQGGGTPGHS